MIRKHTRRAVKAAFCLAFGVAIVLGGLAAGAASAPSAQPTIKLGSKNFTEEYVLAELYGQALKAKGFKVQSEGSLGSSELADTALTSGKINMYPEYTGVIVLDLAHKPAPKTADATFAAAKSFEQSRGFTVLNKTPFFDTDSVSVLKSTATKDGLHSIGDIKTKFKGTFRYAGYPECATRITCGLGLKNIYGIKKISFLTIGTIPVQTLIDDHKADGGDIFSTDPSLASGKYTVLTDTKHIFGFQNVVPVVSKKLVQQLGSKFTTTINAVSAKLTVQAMIAMNKAVAVDKKTPAAVASAFLKANGLK
ncbi:MAG TPA: ABC transporter substrate-binding protein [Gaiellaceae bacterium]|nr:ABC transporter substrate-binding protein [Gaiellaceae bacterium]